MRDEAVSNREWDQQERSETATEQLDRNWGDLLQELRVTQTGVQLLTGFLLTLPFQQTFATIDGVARHVYLATVAAALVATGLLVGPVALHRLLFRRRMRGRVVAVGHRLALCGLAFLGLAVVGVAFVVFDVAADRTAAYAAAGATVVLLVGLWAALPEVVGR